MVAASAALARPLRFAGLGWSVVESQDFDSSPLSSFEEEREEHGQAVKFFSIFECY